MESFKETGLQRHWSRRAEELMACTRTLVNKCWGHTYLKSVSDETWMATWCHPRRLPLPLLHAEKTKTGEGDNIPERCTGRQETRHRAPLKGDVIVAREKRVESWSEDGSLFDLAIRIRIRGSC